MRPLGSFVFGSQTIVQRQTYLTEEGLKQLHAEMEHLRGVRRQEVAAKIHTASESGGVKDNADFEEAKSEQAFVEGRIQDIQNILATAIVISHDRKSKTVEIGSTVTVETEQHKKQNYIVVGSAEASPLKGKISNESPIGQALFGHKVGDVVQARTPSKVIKLKITKLK